MATSWVCSARASSKVAVRQYLPDDFATFAPRTALDMVERIPGFAIEDVDDDRGLGQASGNVLINGDRVSGKSNGPVEALNRIPAENVRQITLQDGATLGIPGLAGEIVDVVTTTSGVNGTWRWEFQRRRGQEPRWWEFSTAMTGDVGRARWTLAFDNEAERRGFRGIETVSIPGVGVVDYRAETGAFYHDEPSLKGSIAWSGENGHVANASLAYTRFDFDGSEFSARAPIGEDERRWRFKRGEEEWNSEFGADYALLAAGGRLKFITVHRFEHSPITTAVDNASIDETPISRSRFEQVADEGESILRAEFDWSTDASNWQTAVEGVFNFLDIEAQLLTADGDAELAPVTLSNANSRVEERRKEVSLTYGRNLSERLALQASAGAEQSELTQTGVDGLTRSFTRPKGYLALAPGRGVRGPVRVLSRGRRGLMGTDLDALDGLPRDRDGPVFAEPWQAQAFALTLELHRAGAFSWREWTDCLAAEIAHAPGEGDAERGDAYYHQWLAALERIVAAKGITSPADLAARRRAWQEAVSGTPHGRPIVLDAAAAEAGPLKGGG